MDNTQAEDIQATESATESTEVESTENEEESESQELVELPPVEQSSVATRIHGKNALLFIIPAVAVVGISGLIWLIIKKRKKRRKFKSVTFAHEFEKPLVANAGQQTSNGLEGVRVVVCQTLLKDASDDSNVEELVASTKACQLVMNCGARIVGVAEAIFLSHLEPSLMTGIKNYKLANTFPGITCVGAAQTVASGGADIAITTDTVGEPLITAACANLVAFKTTSGKIPIDTTSYSVPQLTSLAFIAKDLSEIARTARACNLPGRAHVGAEIQKVIIARDLFTLCGSPVNNLLYLICKHTATMWAGQEQVGLVELGRFMQQTDYVTSAVKRKEQEKAAESQEGEANGGSEGAQSSEAGASTAKVMESLLELQSTFLATDIAKKRGTVYSEDKQYSQSEYIQQCVQQSTEKSDLTVEFAAIKDIQEMVLQGLQSGVTLMLPTCLPPPPDDLPSKGLEYFVNTARAVHVIANLSGAPAVTFPVPSENYSNPTPPNMSITLMSMQGSDQLLLTIASKLQQFVGKAMDRDYAEPLKPEKGGAGDKKGSGSAKAASSRGGKAANGGSKVSQAEQFKEAGNAQFKKGDYEEAVMQYSKAIKLDDRNPVLYSNRAMAFLKLFMFDQAESDCNAAIKLQISVKTLLRRGTARVQLGKLEEAMQDFVTASNMEPTNAQAQQEMKRLRVLMESTANGEQGGIVSYN